MATSGSGAAGGDASSTQATAAPSSASQGGGGPTTTGGGAEQGGGGVGGAGGCQSASDCDDDNPCTSDLCADAVCDNVAIADGPIGGADDPNDCRDRLCQAGEEIDLSDNAENPIDANPPCELTVCASGTPTPDFAGAGTQCGASGSGLECDGAGICAGCQDAGQCGSDTECATPLCDVGTGVCDPGFEGYGFLLSDEDANCTQRICNGSGAPTTVSDANDTFDDGRSCTLDTCDGATPVNDPYGAGSAPLGCNGVCQGGSYLGECGLRVYSRAFPQAGSWSWQPVSTAFEDQVPPTGILAAEMNSAGNRLFVWSSDGSVYEYFSGDWRGSSLSTDRFENLVSGTTIAAAVMANAGSSFDILILTTTAGETCFGPEGQARRCSYTYNVEPTGAPAHATGPASIPPQSPPNQPPQDIVPIAWGFGEQRYPGDSAELDRVVAWKGLEGIVYKELLFRDPPYDPPFTEASSELLINGATDAPAPGTVVAAYYDRPNTTVYLVAP